MRRNKPFAVLAVLLTVLLLTAGCNEQKKTAFVFRSGSAEIAVGAPAKEVLSKLGEPKQTVISPSCLYGEANDVMYLYAGFELSTYTQRGVEYIYGIQIIDDSVGTKTAEGIGVGSSRSAVTAAYGTPSAEERGNLRYDADGMSLYFFLTGDTVTGIEYRKNA